MLGNLGLSLTLPDQGKFLEVARGAIRPRFSWISSRQKFTAPVSFPAVDREDLVYSSGQKNSFVQLLTSPIRFSNSSPIGAILHGMLGAPICSLLGEFRRENQRNPCCKTNRRWNLTVLSAQNPYRHPSTIFPRSLGACALFWHVQLQI